MSVTYRYNGKKSEELAFTCLLYDPRVKKPAVYRKHRPYPYHDRCGVASATRAQPWIENYPAHKPCARPGTKRLGQSRIVPRADSPGAYPVMHITIKSIVDWPETTETAE
ncbi:hypothetical protein BDR06DRAFT_958100 [Suillus hirtellus]|nr:hypothetical protein BDR06DRAFT_958100 [Suillus hirtellus]